MNPTRKGTDMAKWERDEGYSGCETARFGDTAVVIVPPEFSDADGWGYQAFDEADEAAMEYGETEAEEYGFSNRDAVVAFVESNMEGRG